MIKMSKITEILIFLWMCIALMFSGQVIWNRIVLALLVITYVFKFITSKKIYIRYYQRKYFLWIVTFTIICLVSSIWAINSSYSTGIVAVLIKIFLGTSMLLLSIDSYEKWRLYVKMFLVASVLMMFRIVYFSQKIDIFYDAIYSATDLYFNTVAQLLGFLIIIAYYLYITEKKKIYWLYIIAAYGIIVYSGSRKGLLTPILGIIIINLFLSQNPRKIIKNLVIVIIALGGVYYLISNNGLLYSRMQNMFISLFGNNVVDDSIIERNYYKTLAFSMFRESPIIGYGINNFMAQLELLNYSHIAYAHNNYAELAAGLGIIGLIAYYWYYVYLIFKFLREAIKCNLLAILIFTLVLLQMFFEYGVVSYSIQGYQILFAIYTSAIPIASNRRRVEKARVILNDFKLQSSMQ